MMQMENMKLENQKLKMEIMNLAKDIESEDSKIVERQSRTIENVEADTKMKSAQAAENMATAELNTARAAKLDAETDVINQGFLNEHDGVNQQRHEADKEFDAMAAEEADQRKMASGVAGSVVENKNKGAGNA